MQDDRNFQDNDRADVASRVNDDPAPLSEALHIPTLICDAKTSQSKDQPAPLSDALHIPTLVDDKFKPKPQPAPGREPQKPSDGVSGVSGPIETNRATTPAAPPREDAASWIGVPANHQQTHLSGRLATLDKVAVGVGAFMTISPLFAAMIGRLAF